MWKHLRSNGIPKGKPHLVSCYFIALPGECVLQVAASSPGLGWRAEFDVTWSGRTYLATLGNWPDDAQVAWINHLMLRP
jgi:hypothetical protein